MTLTYFASRSADEGRTVRLRVRNKPLGIQNAHSIGKTTGIVSNLVAEDVLASSHTTLSVTAEKGQSTEQLVPAFKPAWLKRITHVRAWIDKGRLPPETDYTEAVRSVVRCFYFETDQTRKSIRDLRRVVFNLLTVGGSRTALERATTLLEDVFAHPAGVVADSPAMNYMFDLLMMARYLSFQKDHPRQVLRGRATAGVLRNIDTETEQFKAALAGFEEFCSEFLPLGAAHLHLGHVASIRGDRRRAAASYGEARMAFPDIMDPKTSTYPISTYLVPPPSDELLFETPRLEWIQTSIPTDPQFPVVLYSADPRFLKRYFPQLAFYMALFPEFTYHVHIVAERDEAEETMDLCAGLLSMILRLRDLEPDAVTIDWSRSRVPDDIGLQTTYYACARYLIAPQLMDAYQQDIWIQDVDLLPTGDIRTVPGRSQGADVMLHMSQRMNGIIPWRRYLAGNVLVRRTDNGRAVLDATARYLRSFLHRENSWCLDQNALVYAVETVPAETTFVNAVTVRAPLTQGRMPGLIEA